MRYENTFVKEVKEKNITNPLDILNWYRNLYHTEDNHTEHGIIAYAINDLFTEIERLQAEKETFEILVKDLRFRNKEFQRCNEGLAKNVGELEIQVEEAIEFRRTIVKKIFAEIEKSIADLEYHANTPRKTVTVEELKAQVNWVLHEVVPKTLAKLKKKYIFNGTPHESCTSCGEIIPEGRQVCPNCERGENELSITNRDHSKANTNRV